MEYMTIAVNLDYFGFIVAKVCEKYNSLFLGIRELFRMTWFIKVFVDVNTLSPLSTSISYLQSVPSINPINP